MILKNHIYAAMFVSALALVATGCSDDDWTPGPDTDSDCMGAYFGELSSYNMIIGPDDSRLIPITLGRSQTDQAASVPINVISAPEGVVVPSSVDFAADQQTAEFFIDIENMASKSSGTVTIALPENLTSPYAAGNAQLTFNVTVSGAWIPVSNNVTLNTGGLYPDMTTRLLYLDGTNTFKLPDFFGSGLDLTFEMDTPGNGWTYFKPTSNYIDNSIVWAELWGQEPYSPGWFLYDTKNNEFPYWSPDGVTFPEIDMLEFENSNCTMVLNEDGTGNGWIQMRFVYIYYPDGSGAYVNMTYTFTTEFSPYED